MIYHSDSYFILEDDKALLESNFFEEINNWKTHNQNHAIQKFKSTAVSDEDYEKMKECVNIMKNTEDYDEYRRAFGRFCYFCHIVPRGVILKRYDVKKSKEPNHNTVYVEYSYNTKKIELPEDVTLYHMSTVDNIKQLLPFFRGKAVKGFLYDKPRIYFTIRRHMPRFLADYKRKDKLHVYKCKEKIKKAFVDPLVWSNVQGAVYIETNKPISVEELDKEDLEGQAIKDSKESTVKESAEDFEKLFQFVTENSLELIEED